MSGRFCKICLKEAQATTWASEGRLASDWISFLTIVFKHWWAAFKSLSNCCPSICRAKWLQMFLNSTLSWNEQQTDRKLDRWWEHVLCYTYPASRLFSENYPPPSSAYVVWSKLTPHITLGAGPSEHITRGHVNLPGWTGDQSHWLQSHIYQTGKGKSSKWAVGNILPPYGKSPNPNQDEANPEENRTKSSNHLS